MKFRFFLLAIAIIFSQPAIAKVFGSVACKSSDFAMCAMSTCASKSQFPEGKGHHGEMHWTFPKALHFRLDFQKNIVVLNNYLGDGIGGIMTSICRINSPKLRTGKKNKGKDNVFSEFNAGLICDDGLSYGALRVWNNFDDTKIRYEIALLGITSNSSAGRCEKDYGFRVH